MTGTPWFRIPASWETWYLQVTDQWKGRAPKGARRSPEWPKVRDRHLASHPRCLCCGGTRKLRVHHVTPFWVDPSLELHEHNLVTLCEAGKYGINCHLFVGHNGNWRRWNPLCRVEAVVIYSRLNRRMEYAAKLWHEWKAEK